MGYIILIRIRINKVVLLHTKFILLNCIKYEILNSFSLSVPVCLAFTLFSATNLPKLVFS